MTFEKQRKIDHDFFDNPILMSMPELLQFLNFGYFNDCYK